ncbi:12-oxophytodienoate reductase (NADH:flavin oxidoreductase/NADH oxidase) [Colletotrichum tofieldiae]|uniref:12-oxophytodienoate reductase (NADH:flavin oxidoreductase/NADH oxidase) n=1 Tax=Colletotrichum tofieldiae TaxID=708197 RepID=A0A161VN25_9PEZI|nr:12-oxophytodienoate reductase (NADH:flavin oxidoreductase/NADH oxidase) [Colletotrichum tofieldiae]
MSREDIVRTIDDFVTAAKTAIEIGFAVLDQFLHSNINTRTDAYGGSPEKRAKFPLELGSAVIHAVGPSSVAIRLEPRGIYNHTRGAERVETWAYLCSQIAQTYASEHRLSYVHSIEPRLDRIDSEAERDDFYRSWSLSGHANLDLRCDWKLENHKKALEQRWDAVVFAKWFVSNPDLPARFKNGAPLHAYDRSRLGLRLL